MTTLLKPDFTPDRRRVMFGGNARIVRHADYWTALRVLPQDEPWYWHCLKAVLLLDEAYNRYLQKIRPYPFLRQMKRWNNEVRRQFSTIFKKTQWHCRTDFDTVMELMDDMQEYMNGAFVVHRNSIWTSLHALQHDSQARDLVTDMIFVCHLCMVAQTFITGIAHLLPMTETDRIMHLLKDMGENILTVYIDPNAPIDPKSADTMVLSVRKITRKYEEWDGFDYLIERLNDKKPC